MQDYFSENVTVRGYELDITGKLSASHILRYFEYIRWESTRQGIDHVDKLFSDGRYMVVRTQQMSCLETVGLGEELEISMHVGGIGRRSSLVLSHEARRKDGSLVAELGLLGVALRNGRPTELPESIRTAAGPARATLEPIHWPQQAPEEAFTVRVPVRPSDIDLLGHMNHAAYLDISVFAMEKALSAGAYAGLPVARVDAWKIKGATLDYLAEVLPESTLEIQTWRIQHEEAEHEDKASLCFLLQVTGSSRPCSRVWLDVERNQSESPMAKIRS